MDFVDEQDGARIEIREDADEVTGTLNGGSRGDVDRGSHLDGDNVGAGGFAESWRAVEQEVVKGFFALASGLKKDFQVCLELILTDEFGEALRAKGKLDGILAGKLISGEVVVAVHFFSSLRAWRSWSSTASASSRAFSAADSASFRR